jgi:hypothetical protein
LKGYLGDAVILPPHCVARDQDRVSVRWLANPFSFCGAIFASNHEETKKTKKE